MADEISDLVQLRNEVIPLFTAANETKPCLISSIMWILARCSDGIARVQQEILTVGNVELDFEKSMHLHYLQRVINENESALLSSGALRRIRSALRLYPVFPWHDREAVKDFILPRSGGVDDKSSIYGRARDRSKARSSRFIEMLRCERRKSLQLKFGEFCPFGGGPRSRMGRQKALQETSFCVVHMLCDFQAIESRDDRDWLGEVKVTSKNLHGARVAIILA